MMMCKPHDILEIKRLILSYKKSKSIPNNESLQYLAHLTATLIVCSSIKLKSIPKYINASEIIEHYQCFHIKATDEIIFDILTKHNEKYLLRKTRINDNQTKNNLLRLFPLKRFEEFVQIIDWRIDNIVFFSEFILFKIF